jgi:hypothetical protein
VGNTVAVIVLLALLAAVLAAWIHRKSLGEFYGSLSRGSIVAAILAFLLGLLLWPYVQARQLPFVGTPLSSAPPYVKPLHDMANRLSILRGSLDADCKITIIRLPELYAEDYAADFKEILDVVGWKYDERLSTAAVKKGISIRALDTPPASKVCAETINQVTGNWERARNGDALALRGTRLQWLAENEAPDYLKDCPSGCVEVDFGNVDAAR